MRIKSFVLLLLSVFTFQILRPQNAVDRFFTPAQQFDKARFTGVVVGTTILYGISMYFLYRAWYKNHPMIRFHRFNDNREWLQMDKLGHATTAYNIGGVYYDMFRWCGTDNTQATIGGAAVGLLFLTSIEIFDGFSDGWGYSWGDMAANFAGAGLFAGQQLLFKEQKVSMKIGWRKSVYAPFRSDLLGKSIPQQMLKDYNGQHSWLSFNISSILPVGPDFPRWLNIAVGHSGNGMLGGHFNPRMYDSKGNEIKVDRYRQWYVGPDVDLTRVHTGFRPADAFLGALRFVKLPMPTLEFNRVNKVRFNPFLVRNK
jgi:hypothetical protein